MAQKQLGADADADAAAAAIFDTLCLRIESCAAALGERNRYDINKTTRAMRNTESSR